MADLAKLVVSLEAETAKYRRELEKANKKLDRFAGRQRRALNAISGGFRALAGIVAAVSFTRIIRESIRVGDNFAKLNQRLGISVEAISELSFAAERSGVSTKALELGLQRLQRRVAEAAKGMGEAQAALVELGLNAEDLAKLPLEDQFAAVADALQNVAADSDKTRLAFKLFDSEGVALLQTIKDGSAGLNEFRRQARELGVTVTDDMARQFEEAQDALTNLDASLAGLARSLTVLLAPAIQTISNALTDLINVTLEERRTQLVEEIRRLQSDIAANQAGGREFGADPAAIEAQKLRLSGLKFELELTETRLAREKETREEMERQAELFDEIKVKAKPFGGINYISPLTIESSRDRILRPDQKEDVELKARSFSLLTDEIEKTNKATIDLGFTFQSAFEDAIIEGNNLRDVMKGLLDDILRILIRTQITGPLGDFFGGLFGGPKAAGGPVSRGTTYLVGEQGPELFTPSASGKIIPNSGMGGGSVQVNSTVNVNGDGGNLTPATLIPILEENNRRVKSEFLDALDRGLYN